MLWCNAQCRCVIVEVVITRLFCEDNVNYSSMNSHWQSPRIQKKDRNCIPNANAQVRRLTMRASMNGHIHFLKKARKVYNVNFCKYYFVLPNTFLIWDDLCRPWNENNFFKHMIIHSPNVYACDTSPFITAYTGFQLALWDFTSHLFLRTSLGLTFKWLRRRIFSSNYGTKSYTRTIILRLFCCDDEKVC